MTVELKKSNAERCHESVECLASWLAGMPDRNKTIRLITQTLFASEYFMNKVGGMGADKDSLVTINPRDFVRSYTRLRRFYSKKSEYQWDYRNCSVGYFLLCVGYCEEKNVLQSDNDKQLLPDMYELILKKDDTKLSEHRLELKAQLIDAAQADGAPALLEDALQLARDKLKK